MMEKKVYELIDSYRDDFTKMLDTGEGLDAYSRAECDAVISKEFTSFV